MKHLNEFSSLQTSIKQTKALCQTLPLSVFVCDQLLPAVDELQHSFNDLRLSVEKDLFENELETCDDSIAAKRWNQIISTCQNENTL